MRNLIFAALSIVLTAGGCSLAQFAGRIEQAAVRVEQAAALIVESNATAGRDVNEPWTARILAAGYVAGPPVGVLLAYLVLHRWGWSRVLIDLVKGKRCTGGLVSFSAPPMPNAAVPQAALSKAQVDQLELMRGALARTPKKAAEVPPKAQPKEEGCVEQPNEVQRP